MDSLDTFIKELLHLDDVRGNRLLDIGDISGVGGFTGGAVKAYRLFAPHGENCKTMLGVIRSRRGKPSNKTALKDSALERATIDNPLVEKWDWAELSGAKDAKALDKYISDVYNALDLKGNNPLFLGVGNLTWTVAAGEEIKTVNSPLLIFPIRFVRGTNTSPVEIEFVDDDAYFNPCLIGRMRNEFSENVSANFPHPNGSGADFDEAIDLDKLGDGEEYMQRVLDYVNSMRPADGQSAFTFDKDIITIAQYNHSDICMYYDVRRNKQKIYADPLVQRIFGGGNELPKVEDSNQTIRPVLPIDSVQERLISEIADGKSLIVKGPPGTGKTLTIANLIATLLARGKSILVASEKLSALAEVYAKLPERLRKFVMLLDYETEQKAAAVNPAEIRAEFKRLIKYKQEYVYDSSNDIKYQRADRAKADAMLALTQYCSDMFGEDVAWGSYYDALNTYFKDADLPEIEFTYGGTAAVVTREDYNKAVLCVKDAAVHYAHMTNGLSVSDCPWFGVNSEVDTERALKAMAEIAEGMAKLEHDVKPAIAKAPDLVWNDITYGNIHDALLHGAISEADLRKIITVLDGTDGENLGKLIDGYEQALAKADCKKFETVGEVAIGTALFGLNELADIRPLRVSIVNNIAQNREVFLPKGEPLGGKAAAKFIETADRIRELAEERDELKADVMYVLDGAQFGDVSVLKACEAVCAYADGAKKSIGVFDIKAKAAEKKLRALCSLSDIPLSELATAAIKYKRISACDGDIAKLTSLLAHVIGLNSLSAEQAECVFAVSKYGKQLNMEMPELVRACIAASEKLSSCTGQVKTPDDYVIGELIDFAEYAIKKAELDIAVRSICERTETYVPADTYKHALSVSALLRIKDSAPFGGDAEKVIVFALSMQSASGLAHAVTDIVGKLKDFGNKYFANAYTRAPWYTSLGRAKVFAAQARDRSVLNAALNYNGIVNGKNALPLDLFFAPIEDGEVKVDPERFVDLFVHSYFALVIENKLCTLGAGRNGLSKNAELSLKRFREAEEEIQACNAAKTENLCMARIKADDDDFDFLAIDKGINTSLRTLFRTHARAILKLKKSFILSPSTASVLFRGDAYENFDVVIVDEASQMEPVDMLPVLFRSKQCVLVGDEFQMPPLVHFKTKNRKRISDPDSELTLDTDISALSLALGNLAFDTEELVCHYRSKTESLIEFSQHEFYPYMHTFPATVPATDDLGFTDILTENGYCENGVNPIEADEAVKALSAHFDKYYDEKSGKLAVSVGVVTFGEAQLKYVKNLVAADAKLYKRIETAWRNFNDVPDKLVFFRTIESVQGQETDHLILSLTYGKSKDGRIKLSFGELNRDDTGKNIFNVAVTRAKSKITVIHSVTAQQLMGNPRIAFIQHYLACAKRYSEAGRSQFVSAPPEKGGYFIEAVARYIESLGVDRSRIVTNYGVTDGSIRIPIAVLSKDLKSAELGIWCESPVLKKYDFYDYNVRYVSSLVSRGWTLHKVYSHDWFDNSAAEKAALKKAVAKYVTV